MKRLAPAILLAALVLMLGFLSGQYRKTWDLTQNGRHSLSDATRQILGRMKGPIRIISYASAHDPKYGDVRQIVDAFLSPYKRVKPDIELSFVDPVEQPKLAEKAGIQVDGEMVVEYEGRSEHLRTLNEEAVANLLSRLSRNKERLVMALSGHGERKLDGLANFDLGDFGSRLAKNGFRINSVNLALAQGLPQNMNLLVLSNPQVNLLPGEEKRIEDYIESGGNLLWLIDQDESSGEPLHGLQPLADRLGLELTPGTIVDPAAAKLNAPTNWALGTLYGQHPVTRNFNLITVFPLARRIGVREGPWHVTSLVEAAPGGWISTGARHAGGPYTVAIAMERTVHEKDQRIVVAGTGEFLANAFVGNGGNMDFGVNLVNWLAGDERLISIQPRPTLDASMLLSKTEAGGMAIGLLFGLPLAFVGMAAYIGWKRR